MAMDVLVRPLLLPVLVAQGRAVRRKALILPEAAGPRQGEVGAGRALRLLIVGDSSAAGVGATTQDEALAGQIGAALSPDFRVRWKLVAETGASTATTIASLGAMAPERFDVAVTALGVNDVTGAVTRARWVARQAALHRVLRDRFGVAMIVASGLPPMGLFPLLPQPLRWILGAQAARLDGALAGMAADSPDLRHVPFDLPQKAHFFAPDGYHASPPAYALWAENLAELIRRDQTHGNPARKGYNSN